MKTKIVILGVCALLSGCGGSKRGEGNVHGSINLSNLKVHSYSKAILNVAGEEYYSLGSFDVSELPDEIKKLPPGSEIGTLAVEYQDEVYALEYTGEIKPTVSNRTEETMATVYILKESGSTQMLTLAVKKNENLKLSEISETVSVKHSPKPYCAKARFFLHQVADKVAVLDQLAGCYPNHLCDVNLTVEIPAFRDKKNYFKCGFHNFTLF